MEGNPTNHAACLRRGLAKEKLGDLEGAVADFDRAIQGAPNDSIAWNVRGWVKYLKKDFDGAIDDAGRAIRLDPNSGAAYGTRAWARYGNGDIPGAVEDFRRAVGLLPSGSADFLLDRGMLAFIGQEYAQALSSWELAGSKDPTISPELHAWIARARATVEAKARSEAWAAQGSRSPHLPY
jgi:tetratricopeptide (TPR) repeat protein